MIKRSLILAIVLLALCGSFSVKAQEPTEEPAPTPTPAYIQETPLTSGNTLRVERVITYGDAAVVISVAILWITIVLTNSIKIPKMFIR